MLSLPTGKGKRTRYPPLRKLTDEEQVLVLENVGLSNLVAGKYARAIAAHKCVYKGWSIYVDQYFEELVDAGWIGLCMAAQRFDPNRGAKFCTFAWNYVRMAINRAEWDLELKSGPKTDRKKRQSLRAFEDFKTYGDPSDDYQIDAPDHRGTQDEWDEVPQELVVLLGLFLDKRQARLVIKYYLEDFTLHEIGRMEGLSKERIRQLLVKALKKLSESKAFIKALESQADNRRHRNEVDKSWNWRMMAIA